MIVEEPLYRDRWPMTGPYAGQSFPPFAHGEPPELSPIQQPLPGQFPNPPSDMPIEGLGDLSEAVVSNFSFLPVVAALASAFHGYRRHGGSLEYAALWGLGSFALTGLVSPMVWPAVPLLAVAEGFAKPTFHRTPLFSR